MWKRLSNHLRMNEQLGRRNPPPELMLVLLAAAEQRRQGSVAGPYRRRELAALATAERESGGALPRR